MRDGENRTEHGCPASRNSPEVNDKVSESDDSWSRGVKNSTEGDDSWASWGFLGFPESLSDGIKTESGPE